MLREKDYAASAGGATMYASKLNEGEWDLVLKNCNAFSGWIIDFDGNRIARAPHAAFRLRSGLNLETVSPKVVPEEPSNEPPPPYTLGTQVPDNQTVQVAEKTLEPLKPEDIKNYVPPKARGIPTFAVTDDTGIEVALVKHKFSMSMAENHFDKTVFQAEASGAFKGVTVAAQGGKAEENQQGNKQSEGQFSKTLVATYRVPRATIYLSSEDLEPTKEFIAAINRVRETRNIVDLKRLHKMFGQIFCTEIVIGGCLQTSKTLDADKSASESVARHNLKGSVGLAVGVPKLGSASFKASRETQDHSESGSSTFDQRESLSFNTTGGNTVLAASPPAWLTSVGSDFNSWRVIQQGELRAVMDVVSGIPGYEEVRMWFLQAAPKLTQYIVVPQSRAIDARFKLDLNSSGLSRALAGADVGLTKDQKSTKIQTYLAHDPNIPPVHVRTYVRQFEHAPEVTKSAMRFEGFRAIVDVTQKIYQTSQKSSHAVFQPVNTQAAVLLDPRVCRIESKDGKPVVDKRTVWTMEVPYGYSIKHESLVTLKSRAKDTPGTSLSLTVYRNAQGVFMPSITSSSEPAYWRVLKADRGYEADADQIRFGDAIRLCWRFSDQPSGWRDCADDFYGRRRFDRPAELRPEEDGLYFKVPFPRFEAINDPRGISILLSPSSTSDPILETTTLREPIKPTGTEKAAYNLFDVAFRLDYVGNDGVGEAFDYMNVAREEDSLTNVTDLKTALKSPEPQSAGAVAGNLLKNVAGTYVKQIDDLSNAVSSGSPGAVVTQVFKTAVKLSPIGAMASIFGF